MTFRLLFITTAFMLLAGCANAGESTQLTPKSEKRAVVLSLGSTVLPLAAGFGALSASSGRGGAAVAGAAVSILGLTVGPGVGHKYAGDNGQFWRGIALRTAGWGCAFLSFAAGFSDVGLSEQGSPWEIVVVASLAVVGGSIVYDIATADDSARQYNQSRGLTGVSITPTYDLTDNTAGLRLSMRF